MKGELTANPKADALCLMNDTAEESGRETDTERESSDISDTGKWYFSYLAEYNILSILMPLFSFINNTYTYVNRLYNKIHHA